MGNTGNKETPGVPTTYSVQSHHNMVYTIQVYFLEFTFHGIHKLQFFAERKTKSRLADPYLSRLWAESSRLSTELLLQLLHLGVRLRPQVVRDDLMAEHRHPLLG